MAAFVQYRRIGMVMKEKDDDLALFLELRSYEKENSNFLQNSDDIGSKQDSSVKCEIKWVLSPRKTGGDEFLNSETDRADYDWLLTPPATPLYPSLEMEPKKAAVSPIGISNGQPALSEPRLANSPVEPASMNNKSSNQPNLSNGTSSSIAANRKPSLSGGLKLSASRSATPTGRATLPATTKPSRSSTPTSRATFPAKVKPSRHSTPTLRAFSLPSAKPAAPPVRSSTPTRPMARSSTPTARTSLPAASKATSTSATTNPSGPSSHSSFEAKLGPTKLKNPVPSRGASPTVKSRSPKPSETSGLSHEAPPNSKTAMQERPASVSKSRPGAPSTRSSSRGKTHYNGNSVLPMSKAHSSGSDDVSPVLIGTKMVERVVNMRKLAPPKQDEYISKSNNSTGKSLSSQETSGFGRSLSKTSLDMALRHMDITRSIPGNLRPLVTNISASSANSEGSGSTESRTASVLDSSLATSRNVSTAPSVINSSGCLDEIEVESNNPGN